MQVLCDVVAAVAGADDEDVFGLQGIAVLILAGVQDYPRKFLSVGISGRAGMPLTTGDSCCQMWRARSDWMGSADNGH